MMGPVLNMPSSILLLLWNHLKKQDIKEFVKFTMVLELAVVYRTVLRSHDLEAKV